ncbi:phage integrase N-terminal SAM-like domain-containing protein [Salinibacter ruber]|uniref:phage integrase N-terminal SAM-like domain-containing protein n=1 Tax=Salinibacter ruber TaxID=146919 RepID=UPI003C6DD691
MPQTSRPHSSIRCGRPAGVASIATTRKKAYVRWAERFACVHDPTHPRRLNEDDTRAFLGHLASERNVAASTSGTAKAGRTGRRCCPSASTARSGAT